MTYTGYQHLRFDRRDHGVLLIRIDRPDRAGAIDRTLHDELGRVWRDVDDDPDTRIAVITGTGTVFSAGGDLATLREVAGDFAGVADMMDGAWRLVQRMVECRKPILSAINGTAVGAGLAVALLADISVIGEDTTISDGHVRVGVAAGDHAALIWPLLCGLAKSKYHVLTASTLDGREAERIGLVSICVPNGQVLEHALQIARELAIGPQHAIRWTKRTLNHWLRAAMPTLDASMGAEMLGFFDPDLMDHITNTTQRDVRTP